MRGQAKEGGADAVRLSGASRSLRRRFPGFNSPRRDAHRKPRPASPHGRGPGAPRPGGLIPFKALGSIMTIRWTFRSFLTQKEKLRQSGAKASSSRPPIPD